MHHKGFRLLPFAVSGWARVVALGVATAIGASLLSAVPPVAAPARAAVRAQQKPVPVTSRANSITAMQAAVAQGSRVEDLSARTESAQTFANPDGSWTTESTFAPVRVQHADGSWADIDTTLVAGKDGTVAPRVGQPGVVFSGGGTSSGWQHLVGFGAGRRGRGGGGADPCPPQCSRAVPRLIQAWSRESTWS